jgi:FMN-dependent NADH-azoreductase
MTKSNWQLWKEKSANDPVRPWDLINPKIEQVDEETFNHRYNTCLACPSLIQATKQCKKCACFMNQKAKLPHASCPLGKWGQYNEAEDVV